MRVVIADGLFDRRQLLIDALKKTPDVAIVAAGGDGLSAIRLVQEHLPDIAILDVDLPRIDGYSAASSIKASTSTAVILMDSESRVKERTWVSKALAAGASAVLPRLQHPLHGSQRFQTTLRLLFEIQNHRRGEKPPEDGTPRAPWRVVALGASTGGPDAVMTILKNLPPTYEHPILVVQHIATGFIDGLVAWWQQGTGLRVRLARHGDHVEPRTVYVAPHDKHMGLAWGHRISLSSAPPISGFRPSVGYLFRSVAKHAEDQGVGVLLTGMGKDGARELGLIAAAGGITIVQDQESCVVWGMPGAAVTEGSAQYVLPPEGIASMLLQSLPPPTA